jgi:hypothetical protein
VHLSLLCPTQEHLSLLKVVLATRQQAVRLLAQAVLEFPAVEAGLPLRVVGELLAVEVGPAQGVVSAAQVALETSLLAEQALLAPFTKGLLAAVQVLQVLAAQEMAPQAERVGSAVAEAVHPPSVSAVKEETELSIFTTRNSEHLVKLNFKGTVQ